MLMRKPQILQFCLENHSMSSAIAWTVLSQQAYVGLASSAGRDGGFEGKVEMSFAMAFLQGCCGLTLKLLVTTRTCQKVTTGNVFSK